MKVHLIRSVLENVVQRVTLQVAVEGCCHGELDAIYSHIQNLETQKKYKVDLLLICGDFEAIRDNRDLQTMAVPPKYKRMGDFHK
jgi:lariat debranching enzyme